MKVVVLAGPESSGKSWLAAQLQQQFGGLMVGEYVRYFMEQNPRDTCLADIPDIARGQLEWEDAARAKQPELLILDTHLLSNMLWSNTLFGSCPDWLEDELLTRHYDLHLLLSPDDVEWTPDGQRCQPSLSERQQFFEQSKEWLERHHLPFQVIGGQWHDRQTKALKVVEYLLAT